MEDTKHSNLDKKFIIIPCEGCGNELHYNAELEKLSCSFCGKEKEIPSQKDMVVEKSFNDEIKSDQLQEGLGFESLSYNCKNCGAITVYEKDKPVIECNFCGSSSINQQAFEIKVIQPSGILPFSIAKPEALKIYKKWLAKGWFYPSKLKEIAQLSKITGFYIPFWTYDSNTDSSWFAEAGYHYYVTVNYTDSNGDQKTRQEQRTRWEPVSGYLQHWFDDVLVVASGGIKQERIDDIFPYPLNDVVNYDPRFVLGWQAEVYAIDVQTGFKKGEQIMDNIIRQKCAQMIPGDTYRNLEVRTHKYNITYKHILLPTWIAAYKFKKKTYQVLINGRTGKITGDKPLSVVKIIVVSLIVLIIALIIFLIYKK